MAIAHFFPFFGHSSDGGIWVLVVFGRRTVHVPANSKTDKTCHYQAGSGYHQPIRIFHLGEHVISPSLASGCFSSSALAANGPTSLLRPKC
jgi:hypothetical protein